MFHKDVKAKSVISVPRYIVFRGGGAGKSLAESSPIGSKDLIIDIDSDNE